MTPDGTMTMVPAPSMDGNARRQVGRPEHAETNRLLNERLARYGTLVVAHRGTAIGSIVENTSAATTAALASGADVVEIDLTTSTDGEFYAFHDGNEQRLLGIPQNLGSLSATEIDALRYAYVDRGNRPSQVERLLTLLARLRPASAGTETSTGKGSAASPATARPAPTASASSASTPAVPLVNVDRSWGSWSTLLPALDELGMPGQLLLKSPASLPGPLDVLRSHGVKYPYLPICRTLAQVEELVDDPHLNVVGVELLADGPDHPFAHAATIAALHERGLCVLVNAEVLTNGRPLFAGYDDEAAVLGAPDLGWGPLFDLGADLIQTDWPWLLREYRDQVRDRAHAA